jgi:frataxin-like iron-binding protein CyaY
MEEWKVLVNYPNYSVSNLGNIKNNKKNKLLNPSIHKSGYLMVQIFKDYIRKSLRLHRIIAEAFLDDFDETKYIDHIDRNKLNNKIDNLRAVTPSKSVLNRGVWGKSKYKGAYFSEKRGDWRCQIRVNKKCISLGCFKTELEAAVAYNKYIEENNLEFYQKNIIFV